MSLGQSSLCIKGSGCELGVRWECSAEGEAPTLSAP